MRVLVLGAGLQGTACAFDLLHSSRARVTLADLQAPSVPPSLASVRDGRLTFAAVDVRDQAAVHELMRDHDAAVSAVPYYFNYDLAAAAIDAGIHYADLGGNTDIVKRQLALAARAKAKGVSIIPDCGLAPGMVNILAVDGICRLDHARAVKLYVGGLPQEPKPPLRYQIVYSLEGALDYYTTPSWVLRDGSPSQVESLTEIETVDFPEPVGRLEAFHTAGGLSTMPWEFTGRVATMEYKTLRYPGHAHIMRAIRDLGLISTEPVDVKGVSVRPRDLFIAVVDPRLRAADGNDLVALKVVVAGTRSNKDVTVRYRLLDFYDATHGISAMMRTTGFSLSITAQMQMDGRAGTPGVAPAHDAVPPVEYLAELQRRGVVVAVEESVGDEHAT